MKANTAYIEAALPLKSAFIIRLIAVSLRHNLRLTPTPVLRDRPFSEDFFLY